MDAPERRDRVLDVGVGVRRREWEREHLVAGALGNGQARLVAVALAVVRQRVHGEEVDARPDVLLVEGALVGVAVGAGALGVDADDVKVQRVAVARVPCERADPRELRYGRVVGGDVASPDLGVLLDLVQLAERNRCEDVGEVRLEPGDGDVVERALAAAHQAEVPKRGGDVVVVRRHHAALARSDVLRRVEGEAGGNGERADLPPAVGGLGGVGGVLDHGDSEGEQRVEVGRLAGEVHRQDRLRPLGDCLGDGLRVDVQVGIAHVHEHGAGAAVDDHVPGRRPGDRRRDHLVAGPDAGREEREVHGGGPGREGNAVLRAHVVGEPALELLRARPARQPAAPERLRHGLDLLLADGRRLEGEERAAPRGLRNHFGMTRRRRGVLGECEPRTQEAPVFENTGVTEDAESRRPGRSGDTRLHFERGS